MPQTYSRGVRRVEWNTSTTWSSTSRITTSPAAIARNQAPIIMISTHWIMLWLNTEVMCGRSPPAMDSPVEIVTEPSESPKAMRASTAKRTQ